MWSKMYSNTGTWMKLAYDPLGRLVKRWKSPSWDPNTPAATFFYYDGSDLVQEGPSAAIASNIYVHGARVDEIVASQVNGVWYNHHYDAQGNCILLSNYVGGIEQQYDYDAFGFPYFYTATGYKSGNPKTRFLFTGREWIVDMRVYDFRARLYQPELGRFLQPDPLGFAASDYNLYRYCHNDPVNNSDPTGLREEIAGEIMRDHMWDFACRMDSGNSFQGEYNGFPNGHDHTAMSAGTGEATMGDPKAGQNIQTYKTIEAMTRDGDKIEVAAGTVVIGGGGAGRIGRLISRAPWIGRLFASRAGIRTVEDVLRNPALLKGMSPTEIRRLLGSAPGWKVEALGQGSRKGEGMILRQYTPEGNPTGRVIQYHPGGGHHGPEPYWKVRSGEGGVSPEIPAGQ